MILFGTLLPAIIRCSLFEPSVAWSASRCLLEDFTAAAAIPSDLATISDLDLANANF